MAITDRHGDFTLVTQKPDIAVDVQVSRGVVPGSFPLLSTGKAVHELRLENGAAVTGRLVRDGTPVANARVGLA